MNNTKTFNYSNQYLLPIGIPNPGNFCYIISAIQGLFNNNVIHDYIYMHNKNIDNDILTLYKLFNLDKELYSKDKVNKIINDKVKELFNNNEEFNIFLKKNNMSKTTFLQLTKKIKDNIYHIYIYIYFVKLMSYYNNTSKTITDNVLNKNKSENESENESENKIDIKNQLLCTQKMFIEYININNSVLKAMNISNLVDGEQHDTQEYILTLLDILNDSHTFKLVDYLDSKIENLTEKEMNKLPLDKRIIYGYKKAFAQYNKDGYSPLKKSLYFYTTQFIDCRNCKYKSISFQENSMISIPIPNIENLTIYDCLDKYFGVEVMDHEYKCDECNKKVENNILTKKILTLPNSFIIFLKRFNFNMETMNMSKNNDMVLYSKLINLNKYLISNNDNAEYRLKSVICHIGRMNYGHYYSYNSRVISGIERWFKCNDEQINEVAINNFNNEVINKNAYMLFYEKV